MYLQTFQPQMGKWSEICKMNISKEFLLNDTIIRPIYIGTFWYKRETWQVRPPNNPSIDFQAFDPTRKPSVQ